MAARALSPQELRILQTHQANLKSLAEGFKDAIERDKSRAPQGMREDAFSGMWNFSGIRRQIPGEVRALVQYIYDYAPSPQERGLNMRIMRIALALYFLDKMDEFSEAVRKRGGMQLTSLFAVARTRVEKIFDEAYFSKTNIRILSDFLDAECALASLSAATSVAIHKPAEAVAMYHPQVAILVGAADAERKAGAG